MRLTAPDNFDGDAATDRLDLTWSTRSTRLAGLVIIDLFFALFSILHLLDLIEQHICKYRFEFSEHHYMCTLRYLDAF